MSVSFAFIAVIGLILLVIYILSDDKPNQIEFLPTKRTKTHTKKDKDDDLLI